MAARLHELRDRNADENEHQPDEDLAAEIRDLDQSRRVVNADAEAPWEKERKHELARGERQDGNGRPRPSVR